MGVHSMFFESEETKAPAIAAVRQALNEHNCLGMNPFLAAKDQDHLIEVFTRFAGDVRNAAQKLSTLAKVDMAEFGGDDEVYVSEADRWLKENAPETMMVTLSRMFLASSMNSYFVLREMEEMQKKDDTVHAEKAQEAMSGLSGLHALAKTIPIVCRKLG